ncbi:MAG: ATPase [Bryobacteraceae bacterium]
MLGSSILLPPVAETGYARSLPMHPQPDKPLTFLCLASYEKGHRFLEEAKRLGCRVLLLTSQSLQDKTEWPISSIDEIFYMPDVHHEWNLQHTLLAVSHLCRTNQIDRIIPLDDFDLEKAAHLREHLRTPGMGETKTRYFRDKLAMRLRTSLRGIRVPEFVHALNYEDVRQYLERVPPPWVLKPRLMAGALGIKKCYHAQEVWDHIHKLGDEQSFYLLEHFIPGDVMHVDSIWLGGKMLHAVASAYGAPPLEVSQGGGIFMTHLLERGSKLERSLVHFNEEVLNAMGYEFGVSHTEFIRANESGDLYFLETSARVGGAHIADLIEHATGINMWAEWAKIEVASARGLAYQLPVPQESYGGLLVSLSRQEWPDYSPFTDPELVWTMHMHHHVGFILKSPDLARVEHLLGEYAERVRRDFHASAPQEESRP